MISKHLKHDAIIDWVYQDNVIKRICKERVSEIKNVEKYRKKLISYIYKTISKNLGSISKKALQNSIKTIKKLKNHDEMIIIKKKEQEVEVKHLNGYFYGNVDLYVNLRYSFPYKGTPLTGYYWGFKPLALIFESKTYYELNHKQKSEILRQLNKYRNNFLCCSWKRFFLVGERLKLKNFKETMQRFREHGWEYIEAPISIKLDPNQSMISKYL